MWSILSIKLYNGTAYRINKVDNGEEGAENHRQDVDNTGGQRGVEGGWDVYRSHINSPPSGEGGAVGGSTYNIQSLCTGAGVRGGREAE